MPNDPTIRQIPVRNEVSERGHSARVQRKLDNGRAAIAVQRKTVQVKIPVRIPRVCLPYADDAVKHKVRMHVVCLIIGAALATLGSWVFGVWFAVHLAPGIPTGPGLAMEYLDRVRNR